MLKLIPQMCYNWVDITKRSIIYCHHIIVLGVLSLSQRWTRGFHNIFLFCFVYGDNNSIWENFPSPRICNGCLRCRFLIIPSRSSSTSDKIQLNMVRWLLNDIQRRVSLSRVLISPRMRRTKNGKIIHFPQPTYSDELSLSHRLLQIIFWNRISRTLGNWVALGKQLVR